MYRFLSYAFVLLAGLLLSGCESSDTFRHPPPEILDGAWVTDPDEMTLEFLPNNRFSLTIPGESPQRLTGWAYYPQEGHVSLAFDERLDICPDTTGVYLYAREDDELTFTLVQDDCEWRVGIIQKTWKPESSGWF